MKKYLCVLDYNTGIAHVYNVGVIWASTPVEANQKAADLLHPGPEAKRFVRVYPIDELADGWSYFY